MVRALAILICLRLLDLLSGHPVPATGAELFHGVGRSYALREGLCVQGIVSAAERAQPRLLRLGSVLLITGHPNAQV